MKCFICHLDEKRTDRLETFALGVAAWQAERLHALVAAFCTRHQREGFKILDAMPELRDMLRAQVDEQKEGNP